MLSLIYFDVMSKAQHNSSCSERKAEPLSTSDRVCWSFSNSEVPPSIPEAEPLDDEPAVDEVLMIDEKTAELILPEGERDNFGQFSKKKGCVMKDCFIVRHVQV